MHTSLLADAAAAALDGDFMLKSVAMISLALNLALVLKNLLAKPVAHPPVPQPLEVQARDKYLERNSFYKHAEINRLEHLRMEQEFIRKVDHLSAQIHQLAQDQSATKALRESNGERLEDISKQVNEVSGEVNRISGTLHQISLTNHR